MISPRLVKGGLVELDVSSGRAVRVIALQYNPDSLTRTIAVQRSTGGAPDRSEATRLKGAAIETFRLEAEIDATDGMEHPDQDPTSVELGIHAQLAALETLAYPAAATLEENDRLASAGMLTVLPLEEPLLVFVWGKERVVPVQLTELSITEEAFDPRLNPIRAKVTLGLRVLSVDDLGFAHRGGGMFMSYLHHKEAMAARSGQVALTALGIAAV
jgi:hypothetical protein